MTINDRDIFDAYFKHLGKPSACPRGMSRAEKMAYMADQAGRWLSW